MCLRPGAWYQIKTLPSWRRSKDKPLGLSLNLLKLGSVFMSGNYYDRTPGCITNMVSDLGREPLQLRRRVDRLTLMFEIQHGLVEIDTDLYVLVTDAPEVSIEPTNLLPPCPSTIPLSHGHSGVEPSINSGH